VLPHHDQQSSENGDGKHSSFLLPRFCRHSDH
jgi:hypothetical protein